MSDFPAHGGGESKLLNFGRCEMCSNLHRADGAVRRKVCTAHAGCVIPCPRIGYISISWGHVLGHGDWRGLLDIPHSNPGNCSIFERAEKSHYQPFYRKIFTPACSEGTHDGALGCCEANAGDGLSHCTEHTHDLIVGDETVGGLKLCPWVAMIGAMHLLEAPFEGNLQTVQLVVLHT
jgi:hypothetical protein